MFTQRITEEQVSHIPSKDHWENMKTRLKQFNALAIKESNEEDLWGFMCLKHRYTSFINDGQKSEASSVFAKPFVAGIFHDFTHEDIYSGNRAKEISIHGFKTYAFIQLVLIPYVIDSPHVRYMSKNKKSQAIMDFFAKHVYSGELNYTTLKQQLDWICHVYLHKHPDDKNRLKEYIDKVMPAVNLSNVERVDAVSELKSLAL